MFKVGDFVSLNASPKDTFIVTRIYTANYMAVCEFSPCPCCRLLENEYKVKQKYFSLFTNLDEYVEPYITYREILEDFIEGGYFSRKEDGSLVLNYTEDSQNGFPPEWGLDKEEYPITAVE